MLITFRKKLNSTFWTDINLGVTHFIDLFKMYVSKPNNEIAYHNVLFSIAMAAKPKTIVELGTGPGNSSLAFIRVLQYFNKFRSEKGFLHTCDINNESHISLKKYSNIIKFHLMKTDELAEQWKNNPITIDLLYIDADHSFEQSMKDFDNFAQYVKPNGLILMHDTHPLTPGHEDLKYSGTVYKTVKKIKNEYGSEYELTTIPHLCGIGVIRKKGGKYF